MKKVLLLPLFTLTLPVSAVELPMIKIESSKLEDTEVDSSSTVDIIDKEKLKTSNIKEINELSSMVPNTNISGIGTRTNKTITMRGISNYVTLESSVAMYIDDTPAPFSSGFGMLDFKNIESIEVLKGAQGTLFGKSAQAGVINIYTKSPTKTFKSKASLGFSSYNTKEFYAHISGPTFNKDLTYSISLTKDSSDGFVKNELTDSKFDFTNFSSLSAKLRYNPDSPLDISLNYTKSISDDGGSPFKINTKENPFSIDNEPSNDFSKMDTDMLSLIAKYKESDYTFTSATSYAKNAVQRYDYVAILKGLDLNYDINIEEVTQEFRLKKDFDDSELLVGAFYSNKLKFDYKENQTLLSLYPVPVSSLNSLENPDENMALFTQYKYFIDDYYSLTGGIRYQTTKRSFTRELNNFGAPTTSASSNTTWTHILPMLSLSYLADDNSNTYFTYSQGYRPGGYNYRSPDSLVPFEPETTDSFELGYKKAYQNSLKLNSALFYNIIKDHRTNVFSDTLSTTTINTPRADTYGLEVDMSYKYENLYLFGSYGFTVAKIKTGEYEGKTLVDVPNMTGSIGAKYNVKTNIYLKSDFRYMGERFYSMDNSAKESSYSLMDIALGYKKKNWDVEIYTNNIFDERYVDFMINTPSNNYYHFGTPRVFGIKGSASF